MRLADPKHNGWIEVKIEQGYFKMDAQVRLHSLMGMYAIGLVIVLLKILLWKRIKRRYEIYRRSKIRYKGQS